MRSMWSLVPAHCAQLLDELALTFCVLIFDCDLKNMAGPIGLNVDLSVALSKIPRDYPKLIRNFGGDQLGNCAH